jgi:hypothetical protein
MDAGSRARANRRSWVARPDLCERWPSRLVATPSANRLSKSGPPPDRGGDCNQADHRRRSSLSVPPPEVLGGTAFVGSPADFSKLTAAETEKWAKVVKFAGIKPD